MKIQIKPIIKRFSIDIQEIVKDNLFGQYLFGSYSRDQANDLSDIDTLIIVNQFDFKLREQLSELASEFSLKYGINISPIVKNIEVWEKNKQYRTLFYQEITRDGVQL
ncbi:DNA polymerase beta domain protein region [Caldithrix abyssi DSM 13497]|uniref:DNA polymerase beta domain protein region n=1 Tax=Caldithrix abyssi DSM 13497 TaxID=880073 RepID=H1XVV4_CALAY|nr:nucleotidyltransferase domain-containing protein [Caldithrix abyssi]APF20841.1 Nucleotidyltransferase domain-containing protein [Caldithrix abyssi DSM 13497]EHO40681.1 DNA polymerase beta domain protein region [Caldithrix abyssi DSM 13497]